jgi:carboxyl-terminal processing protease
VGEGDLDYAIEFDRVPTSRFATYNLVSPDTVTGLKNRSAARISGSEDFSKELARIERYQKLKDEKSISLNEAEYKARREAERDAEEEEEKHFDESEQKDEVFRDDFYNREVIEITVEYLKELANNQVARAR